jgi:nucleoside triphosphate diphosphatase
MGPSPGCGLPALTRALRPRQRAGKVGFDWKDPHAVLANIREEADETEAA